MQLRRLFWVVFLTLVAGTVLIWFGYNTLPHWHPQTRNLVKVGQWIDLVRPDVDAFSSSEGLQVRLFGFTGAGGCVGVRITTGTTEHFWKTRELLHGLNPPRDIYWNIHLVASDTETTLTRGLTLLERLGGEITTTESIKARLDASLQQIRDRN